MISGHLGRVPRLKPAEVGGCREGARMEGGGFRAGFAARPGGTLPRPWA